MLRDGGVKTQRGWRWHTAQATWAGCARHGRHGPDEQGTGDVGGMRKVQRGHTRVRHGTSTGAAWARPGAVRCGLARALALASAGQGRGTVGQVG